MELCHVTYVVHELSDHPIPLARALFLGSILAILHQSHLISEAQDSSELSQQIDTVALKTIVAIQRLIRLLEHHIGLFLWRDKTVIVRKVPDVSDRGFQGVH